jgi:hypothetical protein
MIILSLILTVSAQVIAYPSDSRPVVQTVAESLQREIFAGAEIRVLEPGETLSVPALKVGVFPDLLSEIGREVPDTEPWIYARIGADGDGEIYGSSQHFLYAMYTVVKDYFEQGRVEELAEGILITPQFEWITGREDIHFSRLGYLKQRKEVVTFEDIEASFREAARLGCTHVIVNEPSSPVPSESGPEGEIYYRFYAYALDLDQYVETDLNRGTYPADRLDANLELMKRLAGLATKYGLTPGMYIANPRSVPESLFDRYPFLRGARVDHTYRSFEPRYTLTLAHPAVRWHYAEMLRKLLTEVPDLGFVITLLNDSGSGFEYTSSLYPGRNGGPYVVREWRPDDEIARAAAENVIRYYRLMRDTARKINPEFRILTGLKNIAEEAEIILDGLDNGLDLRMRSQRSDYDDDWQKTMEAFRARGSEMTGQGLAKGNPIMIGVPSPGQVVKTLDNLRAAGYRHIGLDMDPVFLVDSDVNREVLRAYQVLGPKAVEEVREQFALEIVGPERAQKLLELWRLSDDAVSSTPRLPLYGGQGFVWYRFWVRPFVPDISKIPASERAYYEGYMLSVFNNPHNIDFAADALWTIHSVDESDDIVKRFNAEVWGPLDAAIQLAEQLLVDATESPEASDEPREALRSFWTETRDRLLAYRSYCRTLRNIAGWIAGVHGYLDAKDEETRQERLELVQETVSDELQNARELLELWESSRVDFIPVAAQGESMHTYGSNLGDLLRKKIDLMERYGHHDPFIDPDYMWRMPEGDALGEVDYLGY